MKKIYWRPSKVPRLVLVVISILAIAGILSIELFKTYQKQPYFEEKIKAALLMKNAMGVIKEHRMKHFGPIDTELDPAGSGLIGLTSSPITSSVGYLHVKQTTVNPNWAAVMVDMFKKAGVKEGDIIAVGISGSFPALAIATHAAAETLKLQVIPISSVAASNWGSNIPKLTWLDMERILHKEGMISQRSIGASLGGTGDQALGMSEPSLQLLNAAITRNKVRFIEVKSMEESINARMALYKEFSEGKRIATYVNVGGGTVSVGTVVGKRLYQPGLNRKPPPAALSVDSVMTRFAREGVPLIHMVYIDKIAEKYDMPKSPTSMPYVGEGSIFGKLKYNLFLAAGNLVILLLVLYAFLKLDIGYRIFGSSRATQPPKHPEPMV
jgi:poly-gamma-glutamate system protein